MSPRRHRVLEALSEWPESDGYYVFTATLGEQTGLSFRETRVAIRWLVRQGYADRAPVFDDMTGLIAGSGYAITRSGLAALDD